MLFKMFLSGSNFIRQRWQNITHWWKISHLPEKKDGVIVRFFLFTGRWILVADASHCLPFYHDIFQAWLISLREFRKFFITFRLFPRQIQRLPIFKSSLKQKYFDFWERLFQVNRILKPIPACTFFVVKDVHYTFTPNRERWCPMGRPYHELANS